jgi:hypothetical protein
VFRFQVSDFTLDFNFSSHLTPKTRDLVLGVWDFIDSITPADSRIKERPKSPL